ncbi:electron transport complex subunit RsxC [Marinomonas mediterranea]|uniref:Ion-translocating oxidoreductase complex subunit C n=1 Tax=Marinomonas mediterranea (strain ATCC 700492 / JCM 21426 / NBRC 103028 / MMB-1) TaxID=717774 RepID=F2K0P4_MARM1|nr:electron transport complex subunit RsxC [Marinomonas mediterranea]ADZ92136.1 electron transport complex, RnfABCDGE type, C subunit [Marinomonas mediterranea MMB-1]WCN18200.1 electron transport complex subunit RsxC [Marinomonas mediterranea MMB-1]
MQAPAVYSFHGGIHPPENKTQSLQLPLGRPSLPTELVLPLGQHIGQPSRPLVKVGETVQKGQSVAINNGFLSSFLHAPTSGTVTNIELRPIAHPSGLEDLCLIIQPDGNDTWTELSPLTDWETISKTDVLAYLSEMGIVGMGGAGFPTQVKLQGAHKHPLSHFIINAAECEPYITADDMLIRERTLELILGIEILQHLVEAEQVVIGIEDNKPTAIAALKQVIRERNSTIQVAVVPTKYPSGGEKQLIKLLTNKEVPSGRHPADIGVLCQNVGTCTAIYDAIYHGKPLITRYTTLTGDAFEAPQNVEVLLGTPVSHLLEYAGTIDKKLNRLVMGGPMMGFTLNADTVPVVKTTNCILAASKKELPEPAPEQPCIRCGMCEQACPASLLPQQLLWFSKSQEHEKAEHYNLFDCIECGACSYVCPSSIPLVQYYRHTKAEIREAKEAAVKSDIAKQRFEARKARQEAEAAEKEAKRLARQKATPAKANDAKVKKPAPTAAPAMSDDSKKAKVDLAIAKGKLKKLEKSLLEAQEKEHTEDINTIQLQVDALKKDITELEAKVASAPAPKAAVKPVLSDEAKKAKVDVALIGTKLKKIQKQLADDPDNTELKEKAANFEKDLKAAQEKLATLANSSNQATAPVNDDLKKAKVDVALLGTKVKKVQKQLTEDPNNSELQNKLEGFEKELSVAQAKLAKLTQAQSNNSTSSSGTSSTKPAMSDELKKAKIDVALASTKLKKIEKQRQDDPDNNELKDKFEGFQKTLSEAEARLKQLSDSAPTSGAEKNAASTSQVDQDALKKLKIDTAIAKAAAKKADKALQKAIEINADNIDSLKQQVADAQSRVNELESSLKGGQPSQDSSKTASVDSQSKPSTAAISDDEKKRKIDLAIAKAAVNKAKKGIAVLQDQGKSEDDIIASGLPTKLKEAEQKLAELETINQSNVPTKDTLTKEPLDKTASGKAVEPLSNDLDKETLKKHKVAAALAKAQVNKLTRRLDLEPENAEQIQQELTLAKQKQLEADSTLEALTNKQENR